MSFLINPFVFASGSLDPDAAFVVGLFHCNGTNGSTTIPDSAGYAWTVTGSAALSTSFKLFGTASMLNGGTGGAHGLLSPSGTEWTFGTNDFCVEFWYRPASLSGSLILFDMRSGAGNNGLAIYTNGSSLRVYANLADRITGATLSVGTAVRIAVARVSGTTRLFVNGTQSGSSYTDGNNYSSTRCAVGYQYFNNAAASGGYYDEIRITNGAGRYSANYTLATDEFPDP